MAENIILQSMQCPTCGASLKASNPREPIECLFCGNVIYPVAESSSANHEPSSGTLRIEGIKTPSSALAHIELLFEEYDWEIFNYSHSLNIPEMDELVNYLRTTSADSKVTWIASAKVCAVPFLKKIEGCRNLLKKLAGAYEKDDMDAYSLFDVYKRVTGSLQHNLKSVSDNLQRYKVYAEKYDADATELAVFDDYLEQIQAANTLVVYEKVEDIPEVAELIKRRDQKVADELAQTGINVTDVYNNASAMLNSHNYRNAMNLLRLIEKYSDVKSKIKEIDKYFLMEDALEICNKLYFFIKKDEGLDLYPVENGIIGNKALIKGIGQIITNYADTLYYLDVNNRLKKYDFAENTGETISKHHFLRKPIRLRDWHCYLVSNNYLFDLDLATGELNEMLNNINGTPGINGQYLSYFCQGPNGKTDNIYDLDTRRITVMSHKNTDIQDFANNTVFYTIETPNTVNQSLFRQSLDGGDAVLIENNILSFCGLYGEKLFYYVGNSNNRCLISTDLDGSNRQEWMRNISEILLCQGGWLYFVRRSGYNSVLCRARMDGSRYRIISSDIDSFVQIKNGYLYYLTNDHDLMKVRMDGAYSQVLRSNVKDVLCVKDDQIVFSSVDGYTSWTSEDGISHKTMTLSLYAVDFSGSGIRKLVYDITSAKTYNEDTIYYISKQRRQNSDGIYRNVPCLFKLYLNTRQCTHLMDMQEQPEEAQPSGCMPYVASLFFALLLFFIGNATDTGFFTFMAVVCAAIGVFGGLAKIVKE